MDATTMKPTLSPLFRHALRRAPLLVAIVIAGNAAAITIDGPSRVKAAELPTKDTSHAAALPLRKDLLTIDWVDAKSGRIGIGGITYVVATRPLAIVLGNGDEVTSIGYLKAGMRARIETAVDAAGIERLVTIRIAA